MWKAGSSVGTQQREPEDSQGVQGCVRARVQQDTGCAFFGYFFSCLMPPPAILGLTAACYLLGTYSSFCGSGSRNQGLFQLNSCSQGNVAKVYNGCPRR